MASAEASPVPTFGVKVHGRLYPHHLRQSEADSISPLRSDVPAAPSTTQEELADSIWRRLPFPDTECVDNKTLIEGYAASIALLQEYHAQLDAMLRLLCRTNLTTTHIGELQKDAMRKARKRLSRAMYQHLDLKPLEVENAVDAELVSKPNEVVQRQLTSSLKRMTKALVAQAFRTLDRLTDRNVTGVVEWTSDTTCKFHYFTESLTQTYEGLSSVTTESRRGDSVQRVTSRRRSGQNIHVRARHEHHLIEARKHAIGDPTILIPAKYRELVLAVPGWLRPVVRIISGTQIRADVVEQERSEKRWLKEVVVSRTVRVQYDPAIVLGDYVLTGWGQQEIDEEQRERQEQHAENQFTSASPQRKTAIFGGAFIAMLLQITALAVTIRGTQRSSAFLLLGLMIGVVGLVPAWVSAITNRLHQRRTLRQQDYVDRLLFVGSLAAVMLAAHLFSAAWMLANWKLACLGGLSVMLACITEIGRRMAHSR